jgi:molecular chaperone Hsp33
LVGPSKLKAASVLPADDAVIVFRTEVSGVHGRLVRLGKVSEKILQAHALPLPAANALGEALALAALLGSALPDSSRQSEGNISIQTRTDGAVPLIYADCRAPGQLRGYARFAAEKATREGSRRNVLGQGHLAITIDQGGADERYQGIMALDGGTLASTAAAYFEQRENLPTFIRLAAAQHYAGAKDGLPSILNWRGGGIMIQSVAPLSDDSGDDPWARVRILTATVEDHELLDPALSAERLLLRLFHEEGVIIERIIAIETYCKCSRDRVHNVLETFGPVELADMRDENGKIAVTCEFCAATYAFDLSEIGSPPSALP